MEQGQGKGEARPVRVCVVGPGARFMSGISYHTVGLCNALGDAGDCVVSAILLRRLLPQRLYPGRARVGRVASRLALRPTIPRVDGVDWHWIGTLPGAVRFLTRQRPDVLVLQWWTGAVLHTYLALALVARLLGTRVVVEFHETLDGGEQRLGWACRYVGLAGPWLWRLASSYVVHSDYDRQRISDHYRLAPENVRVIPLAPTNHYSSGGGVRRRDAPDGCCNLLYLGVIRPYKGLEELIAAFDDIPPDRIDRYWLTVLGETWQGYHEPAALIARSPYRHRVTFVNYYLGDDELDGFVQGADLMVLPYRRSTASGPLSIAMHEGLPVVVTAVGGLPEAVEGYGGAILAPAANPRTLRQAIEQASDLRGRRYHSPHTWDLAAGLYGQLFDRLRVQPLRR